jgi:glutathione peroxidase
LTDSNYKELTAMYDRLAPRGFEVLAFPCNQFGAQEPGSPAEIRKFVDGYGVKFPMFGKIDVNGPNTHPLYVFLKSGTTMLADIKWNFGKFLVDKDGTVVSRYAPTTSPASIEADILKLLG